MEDDQGVQKMRALFEIWKRYERTPAEPEALLFSGFDMFHTPTPPSYSTQITTPGLVIWHSIWCTPEDNPGGELYARLNMPGGLWDRFRRDQQLGVRRKVHSHLATCYWVWSHEQQDIVLVQLNTKAYGLVLDGIIRDYKAENRPEDVAWAKQKIAWLWQQAGITDPLPEIVLIQLEQRRNDDD
jgi:hypothetical protein